MVRLVAPESEIKSLAKQFNTTQKLVRESLTHVQYSIGLWSRWEEQIESDISLAKDKKENPERWARVKVQED